MAHRYTDEQHAWMASNWSRLTNAEVAEAFLDDFGVEITVSAARGYGKNRKWKKDPGVTGRAISRAQGGDKYDERWRAWFREYAPYHTAAETAAESERAFGVAMTTSKVKNWRVALGVSSAIPNAGRFQKGNVPYTKGRTWDEYMSPEGREASRKSGFQKGEVSGKWKRNPVPVGTERVSPDGYVMVKVKDGLQERPNDNWTFKHRMVWEEANGPVPEGCMVVFLDGDKGNVDISNLALEKLAEHAVIARHGIAYHDRETHDVAVAIARMKSAKHAARERMRSL